MATKMGRKEMIAGHAAQDFEIVGRASRDQSDFGSDVGCADMACVNQFGEANNSKYYHAAVVRSTKSKAWAVYLEWGRTFNGQSWNGSFHGQDFQFVACDSEADARDFFAKQCADKNTKRGEWRDVGGAKVWAARAGKDGYIVQKLATRQKGLPDAYRIKDATSVAAPVEVTAATSKAKPMKAFHAEVVKIAKALVGGTKSFTKALTAATGVAPTQDAIDEVRHILVPAALSRIAEVDPTGSDISKQVRDSGLRDLSKMVSALVPREIPRGGVSEDVAILSGGNILRLQQDLDAFESALKNEDFDQEAANDTVDPDAMLNAQLAHIDLTSPEGKWLVKAFTSMSNNRHGYLRQKPVIRSLFAVTRPDRDAHFMAEVARVAKLRKGEFKLKANLQPERTDLGADAKLYQDANVILAIHGTRPVNIAPIMGSNFRLPKSLPSAQITGANFGYGVYWATDLKKSYGYTGRGAWGHGGGGVQGRGCFMFLADMLMGEAYRAPSTGSWDVPPGGKDSVFGVGGDPGHRLENDEHVVFNVNHQRIRYLVEMDWMT
jgi:hypothetical protein